MPAPVRRILCVDDHSDTCFMLQTLLRQSDREVSAASSVAEALRLAERESFDLFVLDVSFPDGSGIELCKLLRDRQPHAPAIFYTGKAYDADRREALDACAEAYVAKPAIDQLVREVERLLEQGRGQGSEARH